MSSKTPETRHFIAPQPISTYAPPHPDLPSLLPLDALRESPKKEPAGAENIRAIATKIDRYRATKASLDVDSLTEQLNATPTLRLANIPKGNHILVVHQGGVKQTSIKYLNAFLSTEETNEIIRKRHEVVGQVLASLDATITAQLIDAKNHRTDTYALANAQRLTQRPAQLELSLDEATPGLPSVIWARATTDSSKDQELITLDKAIKHAETTLQTFLLERIQAAYKATQTITPPDEEKSQALEDWIDKKYHETLTLSFGISDDIVTAPNDLPSLEERLAAKDMALMTARIHEQRRSKYHGVAEQRNFMGLSFDAIGMVTDMRRCVHELSNESFAATRDKYFDTHTDGSFHLKLAIIELLRKGKPGVFEEQVPEQEAQRIIQMYYHVINRFDCIKPWPDHAAWQADIEEKRRVLASYDPFQLRQALLKNPKPIADMSEAQFHAEASKVKHGVCVMFDQIGMGNENVDSFQQIFWKTWQTIALTLTQAGTPPVIDYHRNQLAIRGDQLTEIKTILKQSTADAGRAVTEKFYRNAAIAREDLQSYLRRRNQIAGLDTPPHLISAAYMGDEYMAMIPVEHVPEWGQGKIIADNNDDLLITLANIQAKTGWRVSTTYRSPNDSVAAQYPDFTVDPDVTDYFKALDALDIGIKQAKTCEGIGFPQVICVQLPSGAVAGVMKNDEGRVIVVKLINLLIGKAEELAHAGKHDKQDLIQELLVVQAQMS